MIQTSKLSFSVARILAEQFPRENIVDLDPKIAFDAWLRYVGIVGYADQILQVRDMLKASYQELAARTDKADEPTDVALYHAMIGIQSKSGKLASIIKKHNVYAANLDKKHVAEEIGDLMWYIAKLCNICGLNLEEICVDNIEKLKRRYPEKFDSRLAIKRADKKVLASHIHGTVLIYIGDDARANIVLVKGKKYILDHWTAKGDLFVTDPVTKTRIGIFDPSLFEVE